MNRLLKLWFNYEDEILHFVFGYLVSSIFQSTGHFMVLAAILIGLWKELYDIKQGGKFSPLDFACTFAGGFVAYVILITSTLFGYYLPGV